MGIRDTEMIWRGQDGFWEQAFLLGEVQKEQKRPGSSRWKSSSLCGVCKARLFIKQMQRGKHGKKSSYQSVQWPEVQTEASPLHVSEAKGEIFCTGTCTQIQILPWSAGKGQSIRANWTRSGSPPRTGVTPQYWFEREELVMSNFPEATKLCRLLFYLKWDTCLWSSVLRLREGRGALENRLRNYQE